MKLYTVVFTISRDKCFGIRKLQNRPAVVVVAWIVRVRSSHSVDGTFEGSVVRIPLEAYVYMVL